METIVTADIEYQEKLRKVVDAFASGDYDLFGTVCEDCILSDREAPESLFLLGVISFMTNDPGQAMRMVRRAHEIDDECGTYADVLANLYARYGRLTDSLYFAKLSPTLEPHPILGGLLISGLDNYFKALSESEKPNFIKTAAADFKNGDFQSAREAGEKELRLEKREPELYYLLGRVYVEMGLCKKALSMFRALTHLDGTSVRFRLLLADALAKNGRFEQAEACFRVAAKMGGKSHPESWLLKRLGLDSGLDFGPAIDGNVDEPALENSALDPTPYDGGRPLRVGILSDQFRSSGAFDIVAPWIIHADKKMVEIYCYNASEISDERTVALKRRATKWSDIAEIDDQTLLYILDADGIDVMIDYTLDWTVARDNVLERGIAPVRLGLAERGGPQTSSLPTHVWTGTALIARDDFESLDKASRIDAFASLLTTGSDPGKVVGDLPCHRNAAPVFGTDLSLAGFKADVVSAWVKLLEATPGSRLLLGNVPHVPEELVLEAYEVFSNFGLLERIMVQKNTDTTAFWSLIDMYLPSPHISVSQALLNAGLAGRPVVAYAGHAAETVRGLMKAAGMPKWAADNWDDYHLIATRIVSDIQAGAVTAGGVRTSLETAETLNCENRIHACYQGLRLHFEKA